MQFEIPTTSGKPLQIDLNSGETLYIVGTNGAGKSALLLELLGQSGGTPTRWLSARRQVHLSSIVGTIGFITADEPNYRQDVPEARQNFFENQFGKEFLAAGRWQELEPEDRLTKPLFDLLTLENRRAYAIADSVERETCAAVRDEVSKSRSPTSQINEALKEAGLNISITVEPDWKIMAHNREGATYDLTYASDGERNAVVMAATVLTAPEGALFLIDEPDRHLHPSVVVPLMTAPAELRLDCLFVVSTYDASLPESNRNAGALVVRSCTWIDNNPTAWDLDEIKPGQPLPEEVRSALLGARTQTILVEGTENSLDTRLYSILFPDADVRPSGGYGDVENAVGALRLNSAYTRIEAFGIVDGDGRLEQVGETSVGSGVYVMEPFCVECLYYCEDAIRAVAAHQAPAVGRDADEIVASTKESVLSALADERIAEQLAGRRSWRQVSGDIVRKAPSVDDIVSNKGTGFTIKLGSPFLNELERYKRLLDASDFGSLSERYPIYRSNALNALAGQMGLSSREAYQNTLLYLVGRDSDLADKLREHLGPWAKDWASHQES